MINFNYSIPSQWPQTQTNYPRNACIHELFELQATQTPQTIAVVFEELILTYAQLNRRANQLAHHLRSLGIGPESLVGICVERSVEMMVGLLGILKAGGAYVPLDPTYPPSRLTWMLEDAQVQVLLTQAKLEHFTENLKSTLSPLTTIRLDTDWPTLANKSEANLVNQTTAENLAYVMYTSGSTGQPKGVSVVHRGVVRLVKNTNYANFTADEIFLQLAPISFDASTFEIWGALLNGAKLVVMSPPPPSLAELGDALRRSQVTTLWLTAGLFHQMVNERLEDLQELRQLLAGGEALSVPHVKKVLQTLKNGVLINGYGPTENTTFTCCYPMTEVSQVGETVPIGPPISNTQVYILDEQRHPVPIGTPGELYVGGDGLAREYFRRPELTAEKFVYVPILEDNPEPLRLYKTGDLVRYRPDGILESNQTPRVSH
jgi:amino acid adenylation domain-containing protein